MKHQIMSVACGAALMGAATVGCQDNAHKNPFLEPYTTQYEIPPFDQISYDDYLPALKAGIDQHQRQIDSIVANPETPTFENTILALDRSGEILEKVVAVFSNLDESNSSPEMVKIAEEFYPALSKHSDETAMNDKLFERVKYLYDHPELGYATDQRRMIEETYKSFTRSGALLDASHKEELKTINAELTDLYLKFNKNLLNATNEFAIVVDDSTKLSGLPASSIAVAAEEAAKRELGENKWVFTLHAPSRLPLLQYADNRDLRKQMYEGYTTLASSGQYDNNPVISKILIARSKKARLLGFDNFGSYMTDKVMAKTIERAEDLLMQIWRPAVKKVKEEVAEMQAIVDENGDRKSVV